jgi:hypothetical protein
MPSPEYAYRAPGSKWKHSLPSGSTKAKLAKPTLWVSAWRAVIDRQCSSLARSTHGAYLLSVG